MVSRGHLEFYTSREAGLAVIGIGHIEDIHKFAWLNKEEPRYWLGDDAYSIVPSNLPLDVTTPMVPILLQLKNRK